MSSFIAVLLSTSLVMMFSWRSVRMPVRLPHHGLRVHQPAHFEVSQQLGHWARGVVRRPPNADRDRQVGRSLLVAAGGCLVTPLLGVVLFMAMHAVGVMRASQRSRSDEERVAAGLAEVVDLFAVMLRSGHNMTASVAEVGRWVEGPVGEGFAWCSHVSARGEPIARALEELPERLGPVVRPLVSALVANERHGAPIVAGLAQLAADHRADRRRRAETAARRLPVHLLMPLILCVLPAFMLLTVVPVVAETFRNLDVFSSA